ncbi:Endo-1,4-beta-D-glucanase [Penicillium ucsense]|uniref:cellulase n=1 Tax=Penicillium ucsense TaxID=2839758 RepID=A0A8J8W4P3_9EURO|nr:Endo-1,4-beta-D-glucanase [Penicillium ucsense]KAF7739018.1 Endo-1,4-beta-D-glucanase [Penicillium ucsense]
MKNCSLIPSRLPVRRELPRVLHSNVWVGVNECGLEFGEGKLPGVWSRQPCRFPVTSTIKTLASTGMNIFRVQLLMERLTPTGMTGSFHGDYLRNLIASNSNGNGAIISSTTDFQSFWKNVAGRFKSNTHVIFDTNNEYHDMDQTLFVNPNQAAINGIRAAGAMSQYIFVEGNSYIGAWTWTTVNDDLKALEDPQNKNSTTIGKERVTAATQWLIDNGKGDILGHFAGGVNDQCKTAITGMLNYLAENNEVWKGALWWAAGLWWGDYTFNMEPSTGVAYTGVLPVLKRYL